MISVIIEVIDELGIDGIEGDLFFFIVFFDFGIIMDELEEFDVGWVCG